MEIRRTQSTESTIHPCLGELHVKDYTDKINGELCHYLMNGQRKFFSISESTTNRQEDGWPCAINIAIG